MIYLFLPFSTLQKSLCLTEFVVSADKSVMVYIVFLPYVILSRFFEGFLFFIDDRHLIMRSRVWVFLVFPAWK